MIELENLQNLVIEQIRQTKDPDLLDLIYKLLLAECGNNGHEAGALFVG